MTGAVLQLAAYGPQDKYLTGNPQITYFVSVYKRYTNFAVQWQELLFNGQIDFGKKVYCDIERIGDLVNDLLLHFELPSLRDTIGPDYYYVNSIGNAIVKYIDVSIGGNVIDRHFGMWLNIWSELSIPVSKKLAYNKMIGKVEGNTNLNYNNDRVLRLYVPQFFWFCKNLGSSLPIIGLQNSVVRIHLALRDVSELVISKSGQLLTNQQIDALHLNKGSLFVKYIFLDDDERKFFAQQRLQYLIEQLQVSPTSLNLNGRTENENVVCINRYEHIVSMDFNHPIKELMWVIQKPEVITNVDIHGELIPYGGNQWFNFTDTTFTIQNNFNYFGMLDSARLMFEGKDRTDTLHSEFYNLVFPFYYHTTSNNYTNYIYNYSFSENPENFQPMGSCNFSRIDNKTCYIKLNNEASLNENPVITFFACNYNVLLIQGGLATVGYIN